MRKAFAQIELAVVLAILAILMCAGLSAPRWTRQREQLKGIEARAKEISEAAERRQAWAEVVAGMETAGAPSPEARSAPEARHPLAEADALDPREALARERERRQRFARMEAASERVALGLASGLAFPAGARIALASSEARLEREAALREAALNPEASGGEPDPFALSRLAARLAFERRRGPRSR